MVTTPSFSSTLKSPPRRSSRSPIESSVDPEPLSLEVEPPLELELELVVEPVEDVLPPELELELELELEE